MGTNQIKILIVDDDINVFNIMKSAISVWVGFTLDFAETGADALIKINKNHYDLIISDIHFPEMNGFTLLEEVRRNSDIPFIFFSGDYSEQTFSKAVARDATGFERKPFNPREFIDKIEKVLKFGRDYAITYQYIDICHDLRTGDKYMLEKHLRGLHRIYSHKGMVQKAKSLMQLTILRDPPKD